MKGKFMKRIIVGMFLFLFLFTIFHSYMFYKLGTEPSTLITCVFAACSIETISLMVKKMKEAKAYEPRESYDIWSDTEHTSVSGECGDRVDQEYLSSGHNTNEYSCTSVQSDSYES